MSAMPGQQAGDPLAQLRDIHLPKSVDYWPPAIGWWLLAGLLIALLVLAGFLWRRYRRNAYRRDALNALQQLSLLQASPALYLQAVNMLLRRTALQTQQTQSGKGQQAIAGLSGKQWLWYLDSTLGANDFSAGHGRALVDAAYRPQHASALADIDCSALETLIKRWIKEHRQPC